MEIRTSVRLHKGYGHGLRPGTSEDICCLSCKREKAEGIVPQIIEEGERSPDARYIDEVFADAAAEGF